RTWRQQSVPEEQHHCQDVKRERRPQVASYHQRRHHSTSKDENGTALSGRLVRRGKSTNHPQCLLAATPAEEHGRDQPHQQGQAEQAVLRFDLDSSTEVGEQRTWEVDVERRLAECARNCRRGGQSNIDPDRHGADAKTDCKGKQKALRRGNPHVPGSWKASCSSAPDADQSKRCNGDYGLPGEQALLARTAERNGYDRVAEDLDNYQK